jgi:HK97 family phage portal protein
VDFLDRIKQRHEVLKNPVARDLGQIGDSSLGHDFSLYSAVEGDDSVDRFATADDLFSVINLRARLMSGLNLNLYRGTGSTRSLVQSGTAVDLLKHVNPFWTWRRLARMDELSMGLWGQSFWAIESDKIGPREIWWLKPSKMHVIPDENGYIKGFLYEVTNANYKDRFIPFTPDEIVWFRYPNPLDELAPMSPLLAAERASTNGAAMMDSNSKIFNQGMQAGGFITPIGDKMSFTKAQADDLELFLDTRVRGAKNAKKWHVLRFDAQFKEAQITAKDAEYINGLNVSLRRVCNVYGVPSPLMNDLEHATLANVGELHKVLWSDALMPDAQLRQDEITEQFLPRFLGRPMHAEFDFAKVPALQESATEVWDRERQQIEVGSLTINEWREKNGMPPVPWGDKWWAPVNKGAVGGSESAPAGVSADEEDAAVDALAYLDMKHMELKHGPLTLNGHVNGHGRRVQHDG